VGAAPPTPVPADPGAVPSPRPVSPTPSPGPGPGPTSFSCLNRIKRWFRKEEPSPVRQRTIEFQVQFAVGAPSVHGAGVCGWAGPCPGPPLSWSASWTVCVCVFSGVQSINPFAWLGEDARSKWGLLRGHGMHLWAIALSIPYTAVSPAPRRHASSPYPPPPPHLYRARSVRTTVCRVGFADVAFRMGGGALWWLPRTPCSLAPPPPPHVVTQTHSAAPSPSPKGLLRSS
jgi:hypothetical protein